MAHITYHAGRQTGVHRTERTTNTDGLGFLLRGLRGRQQGMKDWKIDACLQATFKAQERAARGSAFLGVDIKVRLHFQSCQSEWCLQGPCRKRSSCMDTMQSTA